MMKRVLLYIFIAMVIVLTAGCVSKQDYDAVVKERDDLKAQVTSLQTDLDKYKSVKTEAARIQARLAKETAALKIFSDYYYSITQLFSVDTNYSGSISATASVNANNITRVQTATVTFMTDFALAVKDIDNPQLSQLWKDLMQAAARNEAKEISSKLSTILALLSQMIADDTAALATAVK